MDVSSGGWTPFSVSRFEMEDTGFGLGLTWGRKKKGTFSQRRVSSTNIM